MRMEGGSRPFKRKKLAFNNQAMFEKQFSTVFETCFCVVSKMMFNNHVNIDGSINMEQAGFLRKYQLWSYIYYLYYYNNSSLEEFAAMKGELGKASAVRFYEVVKAVVQNQFVPEESVTPLDVNTLIYFVNIIMAKYRGEGAIAESNIKNPVVDYIRGVLARGKGEEGVRLKKLSVVTGKESGNVNVVTDSAGVGNANVKVTFDYPRNDAKGGRRVCKRA